MYFKNNFSSGKITAKEATATSWVITPLGLEYSYEDTVNKPESGKPMVRSLIYLESELNNATLKLLRKDEDKTTVVSIPVSFHFSESKLKEIEDPSEYDVYLDETLLDENVPFKSGGVYTVVGSNITYNNKPLIVGKTITVTQPNSLHMAWMLPQYIIITMAEVMFSVTGLQFAFTQAPVSMKSLLQAGWLLSVAFGNLIVVIVKGAHPFERLVSNQLYILFLALISIFTFHMIYLFISQVYEIFLYAGLMAVVMVIFAVMTIFYKYVEMPEEDNDVAIPLEENDGNVNLAYKDDEKR